MVGFGFGFFVWLFVFCFLVVFFLNNIALLSMLWSIHLFLLLILTDKVSKHFTVSSILGYPGARQLRGWREFIHQWEFTPCSCSAVAKWKAVTCDDTTGTSQELNQSAIISMWLLEGMSNSSLFLLMAVHKWYKQQVSKQFWKGAALWSTQFLKMCSVWSWRLSST